MNQIIRTLDRQEHGLVHRFLFGINTFDMNRVPYSPTEDPTRIFLSALTRQWRCSAQVGAIAMEECAIHSPEAVFGAADGDMPYFQTRIGFNDGFFDLASLKLNKRQQVGGCTVQRQSTFGDCFFPQVTPAFWQYPTILGHGLALYICPTSEASDVEATMKKLVTSPFPGDERWHQAVTELYRVVLLSGHDGEYFRAWARSEEDFNVLNDALFQAEASIKASYWYQSNKARLIWSETPWLVTVCLPE